MRAMLKTLVGLCVGTALAGGSLAAQVTGRAAFEGESDGQQSDASVPAYIQSFTAPGGTLLEAIRWWGFHGEHSNGSAFDNFVVTLDGVPQSGELVKSPSPHFDEYTLYFDDIVLTASELSVVNDSLDVEWFWQSAAKVGNSDLPDAIDVAFSLIGRPGGLTVDEPEMPSLILAAIAALVWARNRRLSHLPTPPMA